jgi:integrase
MPIYFRNARWEIRLQFKGQKYYRQLPEAKNKAQAKVAEAHLLTEIYEGRYGREGQEIGATDFVKFARDVYLPTAQRQLKDPAKVTHVVATLCRYFRGKRLKDIKPMLIEGYKRHRLAGDSQLGRPRHPATVKAEIGFLSRIFEMAIENDLIGLNPCRKVRWKRGETDCRRESVLTHEEEVKLLAQLEYYPEAKAATLIALNTGLRRMEILKLKAGDVDLAGGRCIVTGKGGKLRLVPLNAEARCVIAQLMADLQPAGFLFRRRTGHNLSVTSGAFHLAMRRAGIKGFRFHDLRHTFSSRVRAHTDAFTVRDLMGHSHVQTTDIYVTAHFTEMQRAVEALGMGENVIPFAKSGKTFTQASPETAKATKTA